MADEVVLDVLRLTTRFFASFGTVTAVDDLSLTVNKGEIVGVVGESGSGKSALAKSIMGLLPKAGRVESGQVMLQGRDLLKMSPAELRAARGDELSMVFQNPMGSLNPSLRVGWQVEEAFLTHKKGSREDARSKALGALSEVGISDPKARSRAYPHQFSGGMQQRIAIAMGILNEPALLLADEPTTALDVTIQAQILELMRRLSREQGMAMLLITHDMGVIAKMCDRVAVMYAGQIVEESPVHELFAQPLHPYTWALFNSLPSIHRSQQELSVIGGSPPDMTSPPTGCRFRARCPFATEQCANPPELVETEPGRMARCWVSQAGRRFNDADRSLMAGANVRS